MSRVLWRWDQGRLEYFRFDTLRRLAPLLEDLEGRSTKDVDELRATSRLSFDPTHYKVWRNYGRVFKLAGLAASPKEAGQATLRCTDLCRRIGTQAQDPWGADDFLAFLMPRLAFPSPALSGYRPGGTTVYPFAVLTKMLLARLASSGVGVVSLDEVFSCLIFNSATGKEDVDWYQRLKPVGGSASDRDVRQVRELLVFFSQLSYLRWVDRSFLFLDVAPNNAEAIRWLKSRAEPLVRQRLGDRELELLAVMSVPEEEARNLAPPAGASEEDEVFIEGRRVRRNHLRVERNPRLRDALLQTLGSRPCCHICSVHTPDHYPWTSHFLEAHHVLPLGSAAIVELSGTRLADLRALCPNCHRAVHRYYVRWLNDRTLNDFASQAEAISVYDEARQSYRN